MLKSWLPYYSGPEDAGSGGGTGTTDNAAGSVSAPTSSGVATTGNVTSGTASEAMIKAAMAASSADDPPAGGEAGTAAVTNGIVGNPPKPAVQPDGTTQPATGAQAPKDAPEPRIVAAVKNARAEVEQRFAWAKDLNPDRVSVAMGITSELGQNPREFVARLAGELGLKVVAADAAAPVAPAAGTGKLALPKARLRAEDGTGAYSEDQMPAIVEAITQHVTAQLDGRIKPLLDDRQASQQQERSRREFNSAREMVTGALAEARQLPHFTPENEPKILAKLQAIPTEKRHRLGPVASLHMAYNQFLQSDVFPSIQTTAEQNVRASWSKKAATSAGSGHPTDNGGGGKPAAIRDGDVAGLAARMAQMAASSTS